MKIMVIATIVERGKTIGMRLFDCDAKKITDSPIDNIKKVLSNPSTSELIDNVRIIDGVLQGINGKLDRYTKINRQGIPITNKCPLVILNKIGEDGVGYTVVDYKGVVKKFKTEDVVRYANEFGIANGKVCTQDNIEYISAIQGNYEVEKVAQSKVKGGSLGLAISIPMNLKDSSSVARNASKDIENNINYNDVFLAMTPDQKKVLKQYYTWYTVEVYKGLAKSTRLNLAPGKAEKLAELRGIKNWKFGGVWDTGFHGGSKCELGHSLRYEYYAIPEDEAERIKMNLSSRNNHTRMGSHRHNILGDEDTFKIIFGETCASDFFNIEPDQMKKLVKTREIMSNEIKLMADILSNGLEKEYTAKCKMLYEILARLDSRQNIVDIFGLQVGTTLVNFINTSMPFPMSLVIEAGKQIRKDKVKAFSKIFNSDIFKEIYSTSTPAYCYNAQKLFDFVADYSVEGEYMYDPYDKDKKRRDIGKYNKETRYHRDIQLRALRTGCRVTNIDMKVLDNFVYSLETFLKLKNIIEDNYIKYETELGVSSLTNLKNTICNVSEELDNKDDIVVLNVCYGALDLENYNRIFPKKLTVMFKVETGANSRRYIGYGNYYNGITECAEILHNAMGNSDAKTITEKMFNILLKSAEKKIEAEKLRIEEENRLKDEAVPTVNYLMVTINDDKVYLMANKDEGIQIYRHDRGVEYTDLTLKTVNYGDIKISNIDSLTSMTKSVWEQKTNDIMNKSIKKQEEPKESTDNKEAEKSEAEKIFESIPEKDIMTKLSELLVKVDNNELPTSYGTTICKDITSRGLTIDKLTYKQKWRVKNTLLELIKADLEKDVQSNKVENSSENNSDEKDEKDENVVKATKIIDACNRSKDIKDKIYKEDSLALKIALTVKRLGRCSDKQLKHLDIALEIIEQN